MRNHEEEPEEETHEKEKKSCSREVHRLLLKSRRIFLCSAVDEHSSEEIISKLWYLDLKEPGKRILFVINSPGGSVDAGFAIWDQVKMLRSPVTTLVTGLAASMGSVLSLCAEAGRRFSTPHARIMVHQPLIGGVMRGAATDLDIQAKEMLKTRERLSKLYQEKTGKTPEEIERAMDRDSWFSAQEALAYGLLDKIVTSFSECE